MGNRSPLLIVTLGALAGLAAVPAAPAAAKAWPTPAAGPSASGDPEVVFTFDDGPNPVTTPQVLDVLAAHRIKAVFFMVGEMAASRNKQVPALVARILAEGHVIANHTMTHADLCRLKDPAKAAAQIDDGRAAIERVAGVPTPWFRAPFGVRCDRLEGQLAERGLAHLHWDLDPQEWKHKDPARTVAYVTQGLARARGRSVVLLHDIHRVSVASLPRILRWLDEENARRAGAGERPIRVLEAPALAVEQLPAGLTAWAADVGRRVAGLRADLAAVLPPVRERHARR